MSDRPEFTVEYLEPQGIDAEPLPDEFSSSRLRRSLLILGAIVLLVIAAIVLVRAWRPCATASAAQARGWRSRRCCNSAVRVLRAVFRGVFCRPMSWRTSTEIGLSELAANSVLSVGGAGGLALGAWILRRGGLRAGLHRAPHGRVLPDHEPRPTSPSSCSAGIGLATGLLARVARRGGWARVPAVGAAGRDRRSRWPRRRGRARGAGRAAARSIGRRASTRRCALLRTGDPLILARRGRLHALRRRDARRLLRRLRQRRAARRRAAASPTSSASSAA